jgi:DNA-binding transcriptional LysR family regulator
MARARRSIWRWRRRNRFATTRRTSGILPDSRLKAREIGAFKAKLYAPRSYLKARDIPERFEDLRLHACIRFRNQGSGMLDVWSDPFAGISEPAADIPATLIVNNIEAALTSAVHGLGICRLPTFVAREAVEAGALAPILDGPASEHHELHVLWPASPQITQKLRAFLDFITQRVFVE